MLISRHPMNNEKGPYKKGMMKLSRVWVNLNKENGDKW